MAQACFWKMNRAYPAVIIACNLLEEGPARTLSKVHMKMMSPNELKEVMLWPGKHA